MEYSNYQNEIIMIILSSEKLKKTLKKFYYNPPFLFQNTMINHIFEFIFLTETSAFFCDDYNFDIPLDFFNEERSFKIINKINLASYNSNQYGSLSKSIGNFE
ncbi:hypothetical protein DMUE_5383 [Dictyocoela muelleri]|nr:hypothetical protein DMUE_5383 [Dictyocoela muelleri]